MPWYTSPWFESIVMCIIVISATICWGLGLDLSEKLVETMRHALPRRSDTEILKAARDHFGWATWLAPLVRICVGVVYLYMRFVHGWNQRRFATRWAYIIVRWSWEHRTLRPLEARRALMRLVRMELSEAPAYEEWRNGREEVALVTNAACWNNECSNEASTPDGLCGTCADELDALERGLNDVE